MKQNRLTLRTLLFGLGAILCGPLAAGDAAAPPAVPPAAAPVVAAPSKVAILFRMKVLASSARKKEIEAEIEKRATAFKEKEQRMEEFSRGIRETMKNMQLGTGDMTQMQEQVLSLYKQQLKLQEELKELQYRQRKEGTQMIAALMLDLQKAIEKVALRENLDIVLKREDAEMAAVEREKSKSSLRDKQSVEEKADPANREKLEKELNREMTEQMMAKLQNTFVWSNDAMDITNAVIAEMDRAYKAREITKWEEMKLPDELPGEGEGAPGGGAVAE